MKLSKKLLLLVSLGMLFSMTACSDNEEGVDATSNPTSARGDTAEALIEAMTPEGAWVFGLTSDITVDGELNIEGNVLKHSGGAWTDVYERKIGLYQRDAERVPIGYFTLTVTEGINVNSPNTFFISDGPYVGQVNADIFVNTANFRLTGVQVNGNVVFASEELMNSAIGQSWNEDTETWEDVDFADLVVGEVRVD